MEEDDEEEVEEVRGGDDVRGFAEVEVDEVDEDVTAMLTGVDDDDDDDDTVEGLGELTGGVACDDPDTDDPDPVADTADEDGGGRGKIGTVPRPDAPDNDPDPEPDEYCTGGGCGAYGSTMVPGYSGFPSAPIAGGWWHCCMKNLWCGARVSCPPLPHCLWNWNDVAEALALKSLRCGMGLGIVGLCTNTFTCWCDICMDMAAVGMKQVSGGTAWISGPAG